MPSIYRKGIRYGNTSSVAQNVEYDNSKSGLEAETVQEAIDELNNDMDNIGSILWENPNTSSTFAPQTIDLANKDWKMAIITFVDISEVCLIFKNLNKTNRIIYSTHFSNGSTWNPCWFWRDIPTSNNTIRFSDCCYMQAGSATHSVNNNALIPMSIIKIC